MARRFGSAMMPKADSMPRIYLLGHIPVKPSTRVPHKAGNRNEPAGKRRGGT